MSKLKEWQNMIENAVCQHKLTTPRLFTIMRDKTNDLQERIEFLESLNMKFADHLTADEIIELSK